MKKYCLLIAALFALGGCTEKLDQVRNPNYPTEVASYLYFAPIISNMAQGVQLDARVVGKLTQHWSSTAANDTWERHGYAPGSDGGGDIWRGVYFRIGNNLGDMIRIAEEEQRWDIAGAGKIIRAWGWQTATDYHGEIILKEAFNANQKTFNYDSQAVVYAEVIRLCEEGIAQLQRTDGAVSQSYMAKGDVMYKGDRARWIKFGYGLMALNALHLSNKPGYDAKKVVEYVDHSFSSNDDDALVPFLGAITANSNYFGPKTNAISAFRQSAFIVSLMNGERIPGVTDPRMSRMLVASPSGEYRGVPSGLGQAAISVAAQRPYTIWNTTGAPPVNTVGRYLFHDVAPFPLLTYAALQFVKAEAALSYAPEVALDAYKKGIQAHMEFVSKTNANYQAPGVTPISAAEISNYMNSAAVPSTAGGLTVQRILLQKFIACYGWGFIETWCDIRRNHYDPDKLNGFTPLDRTKLYPANNGQYCQRYRPRYNSEYVWNIEALRTIGGLNADYHTYEMWFSKP
ncbi:SusD/RagB family nutrient-binding outer membrane lipoprotein [Chitinophaga lutea]